MMPGETIHSGARPVCSGCGLAFRYEVMVSGAGYFVGTMCHTSGCEYVGQPNTRESHYYPSRESCQQALDSGTVNWRT